MMILVAEKGNVEEVLALLEEGGEVYLPRPLPAHVIERLAKKASRFRMPRSTYERLSRKAKQIIGDRYIIESRRGRFARIEPGVVAEVVALRRSGLSVREIARSVDLPKSTVHYILSRLRKVDAGVKVLLQ